MIRKRARAEALRSSIRDSAPVSRSLDASTVDKNSSTDKVTFTCNTSRSAAGSASLRRSNASVYASVHGPSPARGHEAEAASDNCILRIYVESSFMHQREYLRKTGEEPKHDEIVETLSSVFSSIVSLDSYPKCALDVHVLVEFHNGSQNEVLSDALNVTSVALAHAGVAMSDLIASAVVEDDDRSLVLAQSCASGRSAYYAYVRKSSEEDDLQDETLAECVRRASAVDDAQRICLTAWMESTVVVVD